MPETTLFRELADNWMLVAMFLVMVLVIAFPQLALWLPAKLGY